MLKLQAWMVTSPERVQEEWILGTKARIKFSNNRKMVRFSNSSLVPTLVGIWKESEEKTWGRGGKEEVKNHRFAGKWAFQTHLLACLPFPISYCYLTIILRKMSLATSHMRQSNNLSLSWGLTKGDSLSEQKQSFQHFWRRDNLGAASFWGQSGSNSKRKIWESLP